MAEEPTSTLTKNYVSPANRHSSKPTKVTSTASACKSKSMVRLGHLLAGAWAIGAALLSASGGELVQLSENQALSDFFQLCRPIVPPEDIVILAIDDQSISVPEQYYKTDPKQYAYLETLKSYPDQRAASAQVITKLIKAGIRSVALDVVFDTPSSYGVTDDRQLQAALQKYGSKVTLAAVYENSQTHQGSFMQLIDPQQMFRTGSVSIGKLFKNKIVLIGATDKLNNDYYPVAASNSNKPMSGVKIHANAIATLMSGKAIARLLLSYITFCCKKASCLFYKR